MLQSLPVHSLAVLLCTIIHATVAARTIAAGVVNRIAHPAIDPDDRMQVELVYEEQILLQGPDFLYSSMIRQSAEAAKLVDNVFLAYIQSPVLDKCMG